MSDPTRRALVGAMATGAGALVLTGCGRRREEHEATEILPVEDLMREHGVLRRIVLVYDACALKLDTGQDLSPDVVTRSADVVRRFIEDYHERDEEQHVFPLFQRARKFENLVNVLRDQHQVGRRLTDEIAATTLRTFKDEQARNRLVSVMRQFGYMYRAHAAREDTVLFPAIREIITPHAYHELGEKFEDEEKKKFGEHGFEAIVGQVAQVERDVGIFDLATATPS